MIFDRKIDSEFNYSLKRISVPKQIIFQGTSDLNDHSQSFCVGLLHLPCYLDISRRHFKKSILN